MSLRRHVCTVRSVIVCVRIADRWRRRCQVDGSYALCRCCGLATEEGEQENVGHGGKGKQMQNSHLFFGLNNDQIRRP